MNLIDRLLGKRAKTSTNLTSEIAAQAAGIENARGKSAAAQIARKAAIDDFDAARHRAADEEIAEAGREIERRENAIEKLKVAQAERAEVEKLEAFRREDAALAEEGAAIEARIGTKYPELAAEIAALVAGLASYQTKRKAMLARAKELGETATCQDAEDFRGVFERTWTASWPATDGSHTIEGVVEDAPRGSIKWTDGEPVSIREGVEVRCRYTGGRPESLVDAVGNLPKLGVGEGFFHEAPDPARPAHYGMR